MSIFDKLLDNLSNSSQRGVIDYGKQKDGGGHDHRTNKGKDRTPAQTTGDKKRRKS